MRQSTVVDCIVQVYFNSFLRTQRTQNFDNLNNSFFKLQNTSYNSRKIEFIINTKDLQDSNMMNTNSSELLIYWNP